MRTLAADGYSAEDVEDALRGGAVDGCEFRLLDSDLNDIGDLTDNVTAATVDVDVDRAIKSSLHLEVIPHDLPPEAPDLATAWFRYYVQPWWMIRMPNGGWARWPMGVFVWHPPDREMEGVTADGSDGDEWSVDLGDRGHDLDFAGPGPGGFKANPDERVTDVVKRVLRRAGITDTDGIVHSDELLNAWHTWTLVRDLAWVKAPVFRYVHVDREHPYGVQILNPYGIRITEEDTQPETWRTIIDDLLDSIGYTGLWFDGDGLPRAQPGDHLANTAADIVHDTGDRSVVLRPQQTKQDPTRLANRVFCRAQRRNGSLLYGMADADDVVPGHPLAPAQLGGKYIDVVLDVNVAPSKAALEARARKTLLHRLSTYQTLTLDTLAWPAHEHFDVVGVQLHGDSEFGDLALLHERSWQMVLRGGQDEGTMTHTLSRIVQVAS